MKPYYHYCRTRANWPIINIECTGNVFYFKYLNHSKVVTEFVNKLNPVLDAGATSIVLDFSKVQRPFFPSAIVPIVGLIDRLEKDGISVSVQNWDLIAPFCSVDAKLFDCSTDKRPLNVVWRFDESNIYSLNNAIFDELEKQDIFPKGVLYLASWSLNEIMDNVLSHSGVTEGFIMAQIHKQTKHLAFCVFDTGIGILKSFDSSDTYNPKSQIEAIELAIQEEVTSDKAKGQGNGLFGLHSLSKQGDGRITITSGNSSYLYNGNMPKTFSHLPTYRNLGEHTCVDFMVDYSQEMSVEKVLTFKNLDYKPINLRLENMEDERGNIFIKVNEISDGTGTRSAALKLKNKILNILNDDPKNIILDFEGVKIISSSYADELIAKLLVDLGLFQFNQLIRLRNLDSDMQTILQRSVIQRFIDSFTHPELSAKFKDQSSFKLQKSESVFSK